MKRLLVSAVVLVLMAVPAVAQTDGVEIARWDPTGTYIVIDEVGSCVSSGTTFLLQFFPTDMTKRHYMIIQDRVNHTNAEYTDFVPIRGEMWRRGPNTFVWTSILYSIGADNEPNYVHVSTGTLVRRANGEVWSEDMYFDTYWGDQNPLDPDIEPLITQGPCEMPAVSKLEYVPPPEE
jgi:hypothetical protein